MQTIGCPRTLNEGFNRIGEPLELGQQTPKRLNVLSCERLQTSRLHSFESAYLVPSAYKRVQGPMQTIGTPNPFSCFIVGEGSLPIQCAEILLHSGHEICGIISPDVTVNLWAERKKHPLCRPYR